jgi:hypothetical protein
VDANATLVLHRGLAGTRTAIAGGYCLLPPLTSALCTLTRSSWPLQRRDRSPSPNVIARQLKGHFSVCNVYIGMVIDDLTIRHETVHETERLNEVLKLERSRESILCERPTRQAGHDGAARLCRRGYRGRSLVTLEAEGHRGGSCALAADVCPSSIR